MEQAHESLQERRLHLAEMLLGIKEEALLLQIERLMLEAGITRSDEIRTVADLEARFERAKMEYAEGRYQTTEELLKEIDTWK